MCCHTMNINLTGTTVILLLCQVTTAQIIYSTSSDLCDQTSEGSLSIDVTSIKATVSPIKECDTVSECTEPQSFWTASVTC